MEFCKNCKNMLYITSDSENRNLCKECKNCDFNEIITSQSAIKISETQYTNDDLLYEIHFSKYIREDPTLQRIIDTDSKPMNNGKPYIYIKYNPVDMKYMYICEETGKIWRNS